LAVATIASSVIAGCASASQLQRVPLMRTNIKAMSNAQPKCNEGIAANWLATEALVSCV
jgi:hypothetical protein